MEKWFLAGLQSIPGLGSAKIRALLSFFGTAEAVWKADEKQLSGCTSLRRSDREALLAHRKNRIPAEKLAEELEKQKIGLCSYWDEEYPAGLKEIFQPPLVFYYRGELRFPEKKVAVVGARKASPYGKNVAWKFGRELAVAKIGVVSGAARGIDTAAHRGALEVGGWTAAVLGCGVDIAYPPENKRILEEISATGVVISEYAPKTPPNARNFPARNRIISALSDGVAVVEAALKSGALITAEFALEQGRDVFAVPGSIFSENSRGCHRLIRQGAKLVESAADILDEYAVQYQVAEENSPVMSAEEAEVYKVLRDDEALSLDEIILKVRNDVAYVAFILLQLKLRGLVKEDTPHCYVRAVN